VAEPRQFQRDGLPEPPETEHRYLTFRRHCQPLPSSSWPGLDRRILSILADPAFVPCLASLVTVSRPGSPPTASATASHAPARPGRPPA
jgi:hypothetical protein